MDNKKKSLVFDLFQIGPIIFILLTGPLVSKNIFLLILQIAAVLIMISAVWEMRRTRFYRIPDTGKQKELVTGGIYGYVRNPMYLAELLYCCILVAISFSVYRLLALLILFADFHFKIRYEEKLLANNFREFPDYRKKSWRLIPYVY